MFKTWRPPSRLFQPMSVGWLVLLGLPALADVGPPGAGVIESWPARATAEYPRHSEGDTVVCNDGALLVGWTEFQASHSDFATAQIVGRRSTDGGRTWGAKFVLQENLGRMNTMSLSFLRLRDSGDLLMFVLVKHSKSDLDLVVRRSADDGQTWSDPKLITPEPGYHIMNNARAVQLASGRLICPVSTTLVIHSSEHPLKNVCYYSDDQGETWQRSRDAVAVPKRGAMEPGVIQQNDGSLLQIIRTQLGKIWIANSPDQGETWSNARPWNVVAPEAPSTLIPLLAERQWLLIHNPIVNSAAPSHGGRRTPLVARLSPDEGVSWSGAIVLEGDLSRTYAYVSARVVERRVLLTYYVEQDQGYSLKFKSIPIGLLKGTD